MCYLQLCLRSSSKLIIFETLPTLLDIPLTSIFETVQILKMEFNPIWFYSAIFWLASTSPLALVLALITIEKKSYMKSRRFSSFADLLCKTGIKSLKQLVEKVTNHLFVDFCLVHQLLGVVFQKLILGNKKKNSLKNNKSDLMLYGPWIDVCCY